ncbi:MAG: hypothetical protein M3O46_17630 [Myxococcota bacterium]|nr:hypothetical protein [Myxococcota bacterium]
MHRRRPWLLFAIFAAICIVVDGATRACLIDDALITLRYARHFAHSGHATWNPPGTEAPLIGYTSAAWLVVESMIASVIKDPDALIVAAKLGAGAALLLVAWLFADRLGRGTASMPVCVAFGLLLFANGGHGLHVNSAMETALFCAVTLLVIWSRDRGDPPLASYGWAALAVLVRPEGLLVAPVLACFDLRSGRKAVAFAGCALVASTIVVMLLVFTLAYDSPVPSPFSMKLGGPYPKRYGTLGVAFFAVFGAPAFLAACFIGARRGHAASKLALAMATTLLTFLCFVRPIMNDCFRFEWPALFWMAFGAVPLLEEPTLARRWLWPAMAGVGAVANLRTSFIALDHAQDPFSQYAIDRNIGRTLARTMRSSDWLSVLDAGAVPYFSDVPTHDAVGLADGAAVRLGPPYFSFDRAMVAFCRFDVTVVVVATSDADDEIPRVLRACGFIQRLDIPICRCGVHWIAKAVFAREGVPFDRTALLSGREFAEQCPWDTGDGDIALGSWNTWLSWDGATG